MNGTGDPNQTKQIEEMKKQLLAKLLTKEAMERLGRVRVANPGLAAQAELYLLQMVQTGKLPDKVTDENVKEVLRVLSEKKETKITRR